ncbi:MAG: T9SS type A sorting domain-containing protein [Lewinellaceae bacterium]|nr:T9SS type A sorting domain-containing protein [Saprospiraceae bacterium]MCB9312247.1 T9SS type A sorting domain-containing protein [Lewinellaceae bacterium]
MRILKGENPDRMLTPSPSRLATIHALGLLAVLGLVLTPSFTPLPPLEHPVLFVSRQIPCCGSVYMADANALPGVGGYSKYQVAAPAFLCILYPDGTIDTLINGADPQPESLHLIDISAPKLNWDATRIAFAGLPDGTYELGNGNQISQGHDAWRIYTMDIDGTNLTQVTGLPGIPGSDQDLDLSQFHPLAQNGLTGYDDTDPAWLPDGRIVFSSTRYPGIAMYNVTRTSNLFVVDPDGTNLHRITTEKNGADRPAVDPLTGKIVFSRWWRNFYWPYDGMESVASTQYPSGWVYHQGLTSDLNSVIDGELYMFNNNSFLLTEINPDGSGLQLFSSHFRETSANSCYGGSFDPEGHYVGNWFPIEHSTESSGFGGIKRYFRGAGAEPVGLAGTTGYGNLDYYIDNPPSYGILVGDYAAEPYVLEDGRILFSRAPTPDQDYGLYLMDADGSNVQPLLDQPGMTDLHAQLVKPRPAPPIIPDGIIQLAGFLPPTGLSDLKQEGTFSFDCRNIYFNAPVDVPIISAPAVGDIQSVRFFASPLMDQQFGSVEALDFPLLYNEIEVDPYGRVLETDAPANVPLFEQARSSLASGYHIPRTGGGIMDGAAQVMGFNYGCPGQQVTCVGCHNGHSMIPVPEDPEALLFTNLAPGALITASSAMNAPGFAIDRKNFTSKGKHWFSPEFEDPNQQWLRLQWRVPIWARQIVLHNVPAGWDLQVHSCRVTLYADPDWSQELFSQTLAQDLSDQGTPITLPSDLKIQSMLLEFLDCEGGIYHWDCAAIGDIEVIASHIDPVKIPDIADCMGIAYGPHQLDTCGHCLLPDDPKFNDCGTSAIHEDSQDLACRVWPNPASDILHVDLPVQFLSGILEIRSLSGTLVFRESIGATNMTIAPGGWSPGVYFVALRRDGHRLVRKIVIE